MVGWWSDLAPPPPYVPANDRSEHGVFRHHRRSPLITKENIKEIRCVSPPRGGYGGGRGRDEDLSGGGVPSRTCS